MNDTVEQKRLQTLVKENGMEPPFVQRRSAPNNLPPLSATWDAEPVKTPEQIELIKNGIYRMKRLYLERAKDMNPAIVQKGTMIVSEVQRGTSIFGVVDDMYYVAVFNLFNVRFRQCIDIGEVTGVPDKILNAFPATSGHTRYFLMTNDVLKVHCRHLELANDLVKRPNETCVILDNEYAVVKCAGSRSKCLHRSYMYLRQDAYRTELDEQKAIAFLMSHHSRVGINSYLYGVLPPDLVVQIAREMCPVHSIKTFLCHNYFTSIPPQAMYSYEKKQ
jgi:hypothetical protein